MIGVTGAVIVAVVCALVGLRTVRAAHLAEKRAETETASYALIDRLQERVKELEERLHRAGLGQVLPAPVAVVVQKCQHNAAVAVESGLPAAGVPMAVVAWWCPDCTTQMSYEPKALVDKRKRERKNELRNQFYADQMLRAQKYHKFYESGGITK